MCRAEGGVQPAMGGCVAGVYGSALPPGVMLMMFVSDSFVAWVCGGLAYLTWGKSAGYSQAGNSAQATIEGQQ